MYLEFLIGLLNESFSAFAFVVLAGICGMAFLIINKLVNVLSRRDQDAAD